MPMYDFQCSICKHSFEEFAIIGAKETECEKCGKTAIKLFTATSNAAIVMGLTRADHRVRDTMKRKPKPTSAFFDNGRGNVI